MPPEIIDPTRKAKRRLIAQLKGTLDLYRWLSAVGLHSQARAVWDGMEPAIEALCQLIEPDPSPEPNRPADAKSPQASQTADDRKLIRESKAYEATTGPPKRQRRLCQEAPVDAQRAEKVTSTATRPKYREVTRRATPAAETQDFCASRAGDFKPGARKPRARHRSGGRPCA